MHKESVHDLLTAWRAAERRLEAASDPRTIQIVADEVDRLREAYRRAVEAADPEGVSVTN